MLTLHIGAATLAITSLAACLCSCGGGATKTASSLPHTPTRTIVATTPTTGEVWGTPAKHESKLDNDNDNDNLRGSYYDNDDYTLLRYGHAANAAALRKIAAAVKPYLRAALESNGAAGCALISLLIAESLAEEDGQPGTPCAVVLATLFKRRHGEIAAELPKLEIRGARIAGARAWALLGFGLSKLPEPILMHREGTLWTIGEIFHTKMP